jgi:arylsulfatase A-like enzyme
MPGLDMTLHGLINDLDQRGLLDETLVMVLSEHGRTPRLSNGNGGGRDHWSQAYTCLFAGGGMARGRVVGSTDRTGGTVVDRPVSPKDILATAYHLLGIDPETMLTDRTGRPLALVPNSRVVTEMLG